MNTYQFAFKPGGSTHLHEGEGSLLSRALVFIKQLLCFWLHTLQHWFLSWTRPPKTSVLLGTVADLARGKSELVAENALLRHQLIILRRQIQRPMCTKRDRILLVLLARTVRTWRQALLIVQPETLLRWHREGFRLFWRYKSKANSAKPKVATETIALLKEMAKNNRLWGAERIRGELLKLGIRVCKRTIQKYMKQARVLPPREQTWSTFLRNHADAIWACDAPPSHRSVLSFALHLLHHRTEISQSHPHGSHTIPDRHLGSPTASGGHAVWARTKIADSR
jgi:hypothetical protein